VQIPGKTRAEIVDYYYVWKKACRRAYRRIKERVLPQFEEPCVAVCMPALW
jgi:hypothetical protein